MNTEQQSTVNISSLGRRIERLERSNRWHRRFLVLFVFGICATIPIMTLQADKKEDPSFGTVKAERLAIMDNGKVRMLFTVKDEKPIFSIFGPAGNPRITMALKEKGAPIFTLHDADKNARTTLMYNKKDGPHLFMYGDDQKAILSLP